MNAGILHRLRGPVVVRDANGARPSWRLALLVFLFPAGFLLAALLHAVESAFFYVGAEPVMGEVVKVYEHRGENFLERGETLYEPIFRYESGGETLEASVGMPDRSYGFAVGERREILHRPGERVNVALPGFFHLWAVPATLAAMGAATLVPALLLWTWLRRRIAERGG